MKSWSDVTLVLNDVFAVVIGMVAIYQLSENVDLGDFSNYRFNFVTAQSSSMKFVF